MKRVKNLKNRVVELIAEQEGAYGYETGTALVRSRSGLHYAEHWGFRWSGQTGGAYLDTYRLDDVEVAELSRVLTARYIHSEAVLAAAEWIAMKS